MPSISVFGAQWGDEGKGKIIDRMSRDADIVVRYQGGANAGHTVVVGDERYVLHLIPSGILHAGKVNVIGNGVAVDPLKVLEEIDGLAERGVHVDSSNLRLSANAHVIFEHHRRIDQLCEHRLGDAKDGTTGKIGTTGRGIGPCYADKAARTGLRVADLIEPDILSSRLAASIAEKNALIVGVHGAEPLDVAEQLERYASIGDRLRPFVGDTGAEVRKAYRAGKRVLFEGAQGLLLDIDAGTYPFVTSSSTGVGGVSAGASFPPSHIDRAIGIAKAYCTRVGEGPFPSELEGAEAEALRKAGNEFGATTGRPRRAGWFDALAVRYSLELGGAEGWVMTKLDVLAGLGEIRVGVAYEADGVRYTEYPSHLPDLSGIAVEYETLPGWSEDIAGVRHYEDLPETARSYVEWVEQQVGFPVLMVSVGPERDAVIDRGM